MKFFDKSIDSYGFPDEIVSVVRPIVAIGNKDDVKELEKSIATLALDLCDKIERGVTTPANGDKYFTLIDLYVGDNYKNLSLSADAKDLIFEGMILHDLGKEYGAKLDQMRVLAKKVLAEN